MSDLISNLQRLGDAEHDDLSVAHDALAEIVRLRILTVEQHDKIERLAAERDELRRQLAEAEQDARRYQWLRRAREHWDILHRYDEDSRWIDLHGNYLDATIDSAMRGGNE